MKGIPVEDPKLGIFVYKNMLTKELNIINKLEKIVKDNENKNNIFQWKQAMVGDQEIYKDYRDCLDLKISKKQVDSLPPQEKIFKEMFFDIKIRLDECIKEYQEKYNIEMNYMEAINFVKYGPGQHFQVHSDHGFSYVCTISTVMYLNDEYKGGDLYFPHLNLKIKPEYGDIVLFPSNFIYAHASLPVTSGIKYSAVTMFDYNDRAHKNNIQKRIR